MAEFNQTPKELAAAEEPLSATWLILERLRDVAGQVAALDAKVEKKLSDLEARTDRQFGVVDQKLSALESKTDQKLSALESKTDQKLSNLQVNVESRFQTVEEKLSKLQQAVAGQSAQLKVLQNLVITSLAGIVVAIVANFL